MTEPCALLFLNMGGPSTPEDTGPFLNRLFLDRELLKLPLQPLLGRLIARLRTPHVRTLYENIGGSPILFWTQRQAKGCCARLNAQQPHRGLHFEPFIAFRYAPPMADETLRAIVARGITRVIAFSQYPQYSRVTTGSSLHDLQHTIARLGLAGKLKLTVLDRWPTFPPWIHALAESIKEGLARFAVHERDQVSLVFSAHSLPLSVARSGDPYPGEVRATVRAVLEYLGLPNPHRLAWQSAVGPIPWLEPHTETVLEDLGAAGKRSALLIPVAFTCDHIETLYEIDQLFAQVARRAGIERFERAPSMNDSPAFLDALAQCVSHHLTCFREIAA